MRPQECGGTEMAFHVNERVLADLASKTESVRTR